MDVQPRGGLKFDWWRESVLCYRRLRKLKKLICAQGYEIRSDESGMPTEIVKVSADGQDGDKK
jgi:hypothetical protein